MAKHQQLSDLLGRGMYSIAEAAFYAQVAPSMVSRWLYGTGGGKPVFKAELDSKEKIVTFLDFIQIVAVRTIRVNHKLSLQKIRKAVDQSETKYKIRYPLAHRHMTFLQEHTKEILIQIDPGQYVQVTGKHKGSQTLRSIIEPYIEDIGFDAKGLAESFCCHRWGRQQIVMNPHIRFGEPLVSNTGYTAEALYNAAIAEGSLIKAARAYGVTKSQVEAAFNFFESLLLVA